MWVMDVIQYIFNNISFYIKHFIIYQIYQLPNIVLIFTHNKRVSPDEA